jgi:hypothetical protein
MSLAADLEILELLEEQTAKTDRTPDMSVLSGASPKHLQILTPSAADYAYAAEAVRRAENAFSPDAMGDETEVLVRGEAP